MIRLPGIDPRTLYWPLIGVVSILAMMGLIMMISAGNGSVQPWAWPQMVRVLLGFALMLGMSQIPPRWWYANAYMIYAACVGFLLLVLIIGFIGMGAQRWVKLAGVNVQPSEIMKIGLILALARYAHARRLSPHSTLAQWIIPLVAIGLPAALVLRQPNLGTATILSLIGLGVMFAAGFRVRYIAFAAAGLLTLMPVVWHLLHDYQKQRVLTFLDPAADPLGAGYNILQSMIAIGSGGLFGTGYLQGSQSQLDFLPEKHTDFIFTMLAEEFGFVGGLWLLLLYGAWVAMALMLALRARTQFAALLCVGVATMVFAHVAINVGMVMGLLPVVGVPLPLLSYGGSITISSFLASGLLLSAYTHRDARL